MLTHAYEHASAHRIYSPTHKHNYTSALTFICTGAHPETKRINMCARTQTRRHVSTRSFTLTVIHTRECVRVCVCVCVCVCVGVFVCVCL